MILFPALITALAMLLYLVVTFNVGRARNKYSIKAPATTGHDGFDRVYRVQMNTLEQLVFFLPSLWLFFGFAPLRATVIIGTVLGVVWLIGRVIYVMGYYRAANKRMIGFILSLFAASLLLLGGLVGIVLGLTTMF